ncbi:hypothetical protein BSU04_23940 [Caballeronia sordidicola]|jgi:hypothetical protein|uniref:Uncharacterized protein n=1 Tax=Caballeronia sordidicola TaxID=196367 RepID=A0A226WXX7_CABSO|nr:hypothetical protein BSU04_23940 [Caballeronia sordidicola]
MFGVARLGGAQSDPAVSRELFAHCGPMPRPFCTLLKKQ